MTRVQTNQKKINLPTSKHLRVFGGAMSGTFTLERVSNSKAKPHQQPKFTKVVVPKLMRKHLLMVRQLKVNKRVSMAHQWKEQKSLAVKFQDTSLPPSTKKSSRIVSKEAISFSAIFVTSMTKFILNSVLSILSGLEFYTLILELV